QTELRFKTWGGARKGAGRKKGKRTYVPHQARPKHGKHNPIHITLRVKSDLPALREYVLFDAVQAAIHHGAEKKAFRVIEYSVQRDHIHLIAEADDKYTLGRGMQGLAIRIAKRVNGRLRRKGAVFADHYHAHELRAPQEVRNAIVYVLNNWKKHLPGANRGVDACSSARWFAFRDRAADAESPLPAPKRWLLQAGWRRHGLIAVGESPRAQFAFAEPEE